MMKCLIRQPSGIGDVFYTQKIVKKLLEDTVDEVYWPIEDQYCACLNDYLDAKNINFIPLSNFKDTSELYNTDINEIVKKGDILYVPLQHADQIYTNMSVMKAKYYFCNMKDEFEDWDLYFNFRRNEEKEKELKDFLRIKDGDDFVITSDSYGTFPNHTTRTVPYNGNKKIIKLKPYRGFNVFDWCWVFENASEIHMIETCFIYILEKLNLKAKILNLYSKKRYGKWKPAFWGHVGYIPKKVKWNFCEW